MSHAAAHNGGVAVAAPGLKLQPLLRCLLLLLLSSASVQSTSTACGLPAVCESDGKTDWTYDDRCKRPDGPVPPAQWVTKYPDCGGATQSPIDLLTQDCPACIEPRGAFSFNDGSCTYSDLQYSPTNKNWQVDFLNCAQKPYFTLGGSSTKYVLQQMHVHSESEHTFDGAYSDAELHLVHINEYDANDAIVIGFMLNADSDVDNAELEEYWSRLGAVASGGTAADSSDAALPYHLLPDSDEYYSYEGSLTTPPCSEIVGWVVMEQDVKISYKQLHALRDALADADYPIVDKSGNNYRPLQALNGRTVSVCSMAM